MENDIPPKVPAQIGIPIKIVDKTSTTQKITKFKFEQKKKKNVRRAPEVGKSPSTPPPRPRPRLGIQITKTLIHIVIYM